MNLSKRDWFLTLWPWFLLVASVAGVVLSTLGFRVGQTLLFAVAGGMLSHCIRDIREDIGGPVK